MVDLNTLVSLASGLHIDFATGMNDRGEIVGNAFLPNGHLHVVLLLPLADQ